MHGSKDRWTHPWLRIWDDWQGKTLEKNSLSWVGRFWPGEDGKDSEEEASNDHQSQAYENQHHTLPCFFYFNLARSAGSKPEGPPVSSSTLGIPARTTTPSFLTWVLGIKFGNLCCETNILPTEPSSSQMHHFLFQ